MRAAIYCRVSTERQDTIKEQKEACEKYIREKGWEWSEADFYKDVQSGLDADRPGWMALLAAVTEKRLDHVVVWAVDRFGREPADAFPAIRELNRLGAKLVSTQEGDDDFVVGLMLLLANKEDRRISERTKLKMKAAAQRGLWLSRPPIGYDLVEIPVELMTDEEKARTRRPKTLRPNDQAPAVARLFQRYARGAGYNDLRDDAKASGLTEALHHFRLQHLLRNVAYIGRVRYGVRPSGKFPKNGGEAEESVEADGLHPAIVDADTWAKVQERIGGNRAAQDGRVMRKYILTGLVRCGKCGARMCAFQRTRPSGRRYTYYRCQTRATTGTCGQGNVNGERLEATVKEALRPIILPALDPRVREVGDRLLRQLLDSAAKPHKKQNKRLEAERTRLEKRCATLLDELGDKTITREEYQQASARAKDRIAEIGRELAQGDGFDAEAAYRQITGWIADLDIPWPPTEDNHWRAILTGFVQEIRVRGPQDIDLDLREPYNRVRDRLLAVA